MNANVGLTSAKLPPVIWMTGLPGAGKTTIAQALNTALLEQGTKVVVLDGDTLREGLCSDLGFSDLDRLENVRRIAHVARLFQQMGHVVLVATISPLAAQRELARGIIGAGFLETFISASAELCSQRDPKGMYAQARLGKIAQFTGVSSAYEVPANPDLVIETSRCRVESAVATIILRLGKRVRTESVKGAGHQSR
ncbi:MULTISPECIES: adenylyl-sulfate kinase [Paraburkholderia]|jgi:adenylylsulfate kinase|uniref:Adenylyl-sulfate kinase n=1 Tax=Paraburkholderia phenazinium TaxID=60549 RepID=A0A1N6KEI2_9BURK|nr:adenylyl-sulfate kinase [Paraburkholderia phenazinium]SIO54985.1 adenylylsulfate kinase [Paraburkholderia phenazinium]